MTGSLFNENQGEKSVEWYLTLFLFSSFISLLIAIAYSFKYLEERIRLGKRIGYLADKIHELHCEKAALQKELASLQRKHDPRFVCPDQRCMGILVPLHSINKKKCNGCNVEWEWHLEPGQKSTCVDGLSHETAVHDKSELGMTEDKNEND